MFFFKRKKSDSEKKAEQDKMPRPVAKTAPEKVRKPIVPSKFANEAKAGMMVSEPVNARSQKKPSARIEESEPVFEDDNPVKVVVAASSLEEESLAEDGVTTVLEPVEGAIPDEVADSLLVNVSQDNLVKDIETELPLDVLQPAPVAAGATPALARSEPEKKPEQQAAGKSAAKPEVEAKKDDKVSNQPVKETKPAPEESKESLFSSLFEKAEQEEESPLDRLINSLPDISIDEVLSEAEEVKGLMNEMYRGQTG